MKKFSDLGIKPKTVRFVGKKIEIGDVLNQDIIVYDYEVKDSKYKESNSPLCLYIQIEFEGKKRLIFTGSKILADQIEQVAKKDFPFEARISKEGKSYHFN